MTTDTRHLTSVFERYLSIWVGLSILAGIALGRLAPQVARTLDGWTLDVQGAPVVSIPIAVCLCLHNVPHHGEDRLRPWARSTAPAPSSCRMA